MAVMIVAFAGWRR